MLREPLSVYTISRRLISVKLQLVKTPQRPAGRIDRGERICKVVVSIPLMIIVPEKRRAASVVVAKQRPTSGTLFGQPR
jgi:hypothetical protein